MQPSTDPNDVVDLFIIGGGVNGCAIARDAAGRGLSVTLAEKSDLASATSSASTKLFHGGLRYLEYFELRLVAKALKERETLLRAMPHISWPMRFVLPHHKDQRFESTTPLSRVLQVVMPWTKRRRPGWLIRLGLFLYDTLGARQVLPPTQTLDLRQCPEGMPLQDRFHRAFEYSDCWVDDSRLVVLNARDAQMRGAQILSRTEILSAERDAGIWVVQMLDHRTNRLETRKARVLVNAAGPWLSQFTQDRLGLDVQERVRLVRGSHIVTPKLYDHDKAYFLQGADGRIVFLIPYERDFTLIGTTDVDHPDPTKPAVCTDEEAQYLCDFASGYLKKPVTLDDIVWRYSGVRALFDDGAGSASAATRDYVLSVHGERGEAPVLSVFGGKITTHRTLAQDALNKLADALPQQTGNWTAGVPLPGGDFPIDGVADLIDQVMQRYPFIDPNWANRLVHAYGTDTMVMLGDAKIAEDLGRDFGATLTEREVLWLIENEFARTAGDIVWRRSRLGLRMTQDQISALEAWISSAL